MQETTVEILADSATLHTSSSLLAFAVPPDQDGDTNVGLYDYLTKTFATCSINILHWLSFFSAGQTLERAKKQHSSIDQQAIEDQIGTLLELGFLAKEGTARHSQNEDFRKRWAWDALAGAFHFSILNNEFMTIEQSTEFQLKKLDTEPVPELFWSPSGSEKTTLPSLADSPAGELLSVLAKRRTNRTSAKHVLTLQEIGDCLFSAFGITCHVKTPVALLPLSLAPSGGARNPYEPFLIIRRCQDLASGVYHYSGLKHEVTLLRKLPEGFSIAELLGGQDWAEDMAAVIFMVVNFDRSMWKYQDSNAYRVILIEAGHRAQNLMATAATHGLTACPTAALAHAKVHDVLGISDSVLQSPVYALTLDKALPNQDELIANHNHNFGVS
jgi:SagB-type dehydrogenase family enzyme